ncbi:MAG: hypothetical protein KA104_02815 [Candidatus Pacebacteria bacterium]|nr:hypothetical protein [Candidatus Paceibacterota bacterium]
MERNLNDIIPPSRRRALLGEETEPYVAKPVPPKDYGRAPSPKKQRSGGRFPMGTAIIALVVVLASASALYFFSKARVTIFPVERKVTMNGDLLATAGGGTLPFAVISVEKVASKDVKSEGTEDVQQAAQGSITISNTQAVSQQLIKNTRFESADGHIFRIHDSITVPAGREGAPGTLVVTVYADATGDGYNIPATSFKLPGLKGSKAYDQVTAKSTESMTGGFAGPRPSVPQATKDKEYESLKAQLTTDINAAVLAKIPEGYVLLPGATFLSYVPQPDAPATGGALTLSQKVMATAVVFPRDALAASVAYANDGSYNGQSVTLKEENGLTLTSANGAAPSPADQEYAFKLEGTASILWNVDGPKIAGAVAGKNRQAAETALTGFPEIDHATILIRPFWSSAFPQDPSKIEVVVSGPTKAN